VNRGCALSRSRRNVDNVTSAAGVSDNFQDLENDGDDDEDEERRSVFYVTF